MAATIVLRMQPLQSVTGLFRDTITSIKDDFQTSEAGMYDMLSDKSPGKYGVFTVDMLSYKSPGKYGSLL